MRHDLPFSPACERNKAPILAALRQVLPERGALLEIGAGTGQHAVFFAPHFPALKWQASERSQKLPGLEACFRFEGDESLPAPILLDVLDGPWPREAFTAVFSANTAHIMSWEAVRAMFLGVSGCLDPDGVFCLYGPFNIDGRFTAPSNESFDAQLRDRDPEMGIRDMRELDALADAFGLAPERRMVMPANNFMLMYRKVKG